MITTTKKSGHPARHAATVVGLLALAFVALYALYHSTCAHGVTCLNHHDRFLVSKFKSLFKDKAPRTALVNATPTSPLIELPEGCKITGGLLVDILNTVIDHSIKPSDFPTPPDPSYERKMLMEATGSSMVMYNRSTISMEIGNIEIATCWIPGPEGNTILPDFLAVHVTEVTGTQRMKYYLEQNLFGVHSQNVAGGDMEVTVTGFLVLDNVDLHDFNNTVKSCTGRMGVQDMWVNGPHGIEGGNELDDVDVLNDMQLVSDFCYGPAYWDYSFGPRPPGLVAEINEEVRKLFYKDYVAPPPPPPPPFSCDCRWTDTYPCPTDPDLPLKKGAKSAARDDGSQCYDYCCPLPGHTELLEAKAKDHFDMSLF